MTSLALPLFTESAHKPEAFCTVTCISFYISGFKHLTSIHWERGYLTTQLPSSFLVSHSLSRFVQMDFER
jgi:hypothetical protein